MKTYPAIILFFLLTYSTETRCQTASDTAAVLTGTVARGIPLSNPEEPKKPGTVARDIPLSSPEESKIKQVANKQSPANGAKQKSIAKKEDQVIDDSPRDIATNDRDTAVLNAYRNSQISYYRAIEKRNINNKATNDSVSSYYLWALQNRRAIISRQQSTGNIIFILVVVLVLSGLTFSAIQFYIALKSVKKRSTVESTNTSIKASLSGIEVSSSVLGVIVLTISIAFFYLYLSRVYPLVSLDQIPVQLPDYK
jgi:hypothetical protein